MPSKPLRLGYKASAEQFDPAELLAYGVEAEQAGFDSVFVSDHLQPWRHTGGHSPAALPSLGAALSPDLPVLTVSEAASSGAVRSRSRRGTGKRTSPALPEESRARRSAQTERIGFVRRSVPPARARCGPGSPGSTCPT